MLAMHNHLHVHSPFSFLDGAASLEALLTRAAAIGCRAMAITDHNNLCAAVRFHKLALSNGIKPIQGCEITLDNNAHLTILCQNRLGYINLCHLLTKAHLQNQRQTPRVSHSWLAAHGEGLIILSGCRHGEIATAILRGEKKRALASAATYAALFPRRFYIEVQDNLLPRTRYLNHHLCDLADHLNLPLVATANVHYAAKEQFPVHDILTCVRTASQLPEIHPQRRLNAENYLLSPQEMATRFCHRPEALKNTLEIADRCEPALPWGERLFPTFSTPDQSSAESFLRRLVFRGAQERYEKITTLITDRLEHELSIINHLEVADYFLVAWDIARYARSKNIHYTGRGSAADSAVAYCLFITNVDAIGRKLLFERFLNLERAQQPDIDIDFDARYRDDIARYVYNKYGEEHVASVCTYHTYRARSALRDFGKAMGLPLAHIDKLAKAFPQIPADGVQKALQKYPELKNSDIAFAQYEELFRLVEQVAGFPRHIGTHIGGLVISNRPLIQVSPLQIAAKGLNILQFDKNDIPDLGLMKLDLLSLRTLSAVQTAIGDIQSSQLATGETPLEYTQIPADDRSTYEALSQGQSIGVFQLESPAQRALQARLGADNMEDIVASIALIRPGPIQGNMVEPFIKNRSDSASIIYDHPALEPILAKTYGVILYQEQVIEIAVAIAGFTPGEADQLRKTMTNFRSQKELDLIGRHFVAKASQRGVDEKIAQKLFSYIVSYAGYGFCEAHAAAFSDTAYKTAYLVTNYPAQFFAAILSHQPMGFYPPATIIAEAKRRGVRILPPHINKSASRFLVEKNAIRVSLSQVKGVSADIAAGIISSRQEKPFSSLSDFCRRTSLSQQINKNLIQAGAFTTLHANRRQLVWQLQQISNTHTPKNQLALPLNMDALLTPPALADYSLQQKVVLETILLGFSPENHLLEFLRPQLTNSNIKTCRQITSGQIEGRVAVAGIVIRPHRPPTKSGKTVVFLSLEDETDLCDVTIFENVYNRFAPLIFSAPALIVWGSTSKRGKGISINASYIKALPLT